MIDRWADLQRAFCRPPAANKHSRSPAEKQTSHPPKHKHSSWLAPSGSHRPINKTLTKLKVLIGSARLTKEKRCFYFSLSVSTFIVSFHEIYLSFHFLTDLSSLSLRFQGHLQLRKRPHEPQTTLLLFSTKCTDPPDPHPTAFYWQEAVRYDGGVSELTEVFSRTLRSYQDSGKKYPAWQRGRDTRLKNEQNCLHVPQSFGVAS